MVKTAPTDCIAVHLQVRIAKSHYPGSRTTCPSPPNPYQAPSCQVTHVFRAPGLIGSRERWSKSSAVSPSPDFVSVALAQSELCTQHLSRLRRRVRGSPNDSIGRRCERACPLAS